MCQKCHSINLTDELMLGVKVRPSPTEESFEGADVEVVSRMGNANEAAFLIALAIKDVQRHTKAPAEMILFGVQSHLDLIDSGSLGGTMDELFTGSQTL